MRCEQGNIAWTVLVPVSTPPPSDQQAGVPLPLTLDLAAAATVWEATLARAKAGETIDASGVTRLDSAGAVLLLEAAAKGATLREPTDEAAVATLARMRTALESAPPAVPMPGIPFIPWLGTAVIGMGTSIRRRITFLGEVTLGSIVMAKHPWRLRRVEVFRHLSEAGTQAFGLCALLGGLLGLILAFQSSIPMRQYGAEIFIPNLVGISLLRELGGLIAAIILAGRSGSAFAAELGTMKVNEEIDALTTMGIDPLSWLVLPRILAATLVMPALAMIVSIAGLIGMALVMAGLGYGPLAVMNQLKQHLDVGDMAGGLFKAAIFGAVVGLIGCRSGLKAGSGPRAVGDAATGAVVSSIVAVVVLDGIFAVLFFRLGW